MYRFPVYWTDKLKIEFLQRVILIHSYLYYERDIPVWSDKKYDEVAKQLTNIQNSREEQWIKQNTQYGYVFYDFDGSTGFHLWYRLNRKDRKHISNIAEGIRKQNRGGNKNEENEGNQTKWKAGRNDSWQGRE